MTTQAQLGGIDTVVQICNICSHPNVAHDDVARRYCKATMTSALSRNCICALSLTL